MALALGRTVNELEYSLSSSELMEWVALYELEPFGVGRDNDHAAMQTAMLANINRGKNVPAFKIDDFMLKDREDQRQRETAVFLKGLEQVAKNGD